jgi:hypothetical protein
MGSAVAAAAVFIWIGMILAISFVEAPLKFRAPGVTLPIGLGIGRLVFRALNACEALLAVVTVTGFAILAPNTTAVIAFAVAGTALLAQIAAVRPALGRRSDAVLAGEHGPRSHAHLWYVGLEIVKVIALLGTGVLLLA